MFTLLWTYKGNTTIVRNSCGYSEPFTVRVGLYQEPIFSPFQSVIVIDTLTEGIREETPWSYITKINMDRK